MTIVTKRDHESLGAEHLYNREVAHNVGAEPPGQKLDTGKPPVFRGLATYFPRALLAVAGVSAFGQQKYGEWGGWVRVDDGPRRYADALLRHTLQRASGQEFDDESKLRHAAQAAWNALAVLELELRAVEQAK